MWLFLLICESVSIAIWLAMYIEDLFFQIIPGNRSNVEDKVAALFFVAILAGWFLAWYFIYLFIRAIKKITE